MLVCLVVDVFELWVRTEEDEGDIGDFALDPTGCGQGRSARVTKMGGVEELMVCGRG